MKHYFVSDAHLGYKAKNAECELTLLNFFKNLPAKGNSLYLLGDIFEFWFEYQEVIPKKNFPILAALWNLKEAGMEIYYFKGNHDYWSGDFLKRELKIKDCPSSLTIDNKRVYLSHGDEIDTRFRNRLFGTVGRSRKNIALFSLLHPDIGIRLAQKIGNLGRSFKATPNLVQEFEDYAENKIQEGYEIVILAHIHQPVFKKIRTGYYLNIGDWLTNFTYGVIENGIPKLEKFRSP